MLVHYRDLYRITDHWPVSTGHSFKNVKKSTHTHSHTHLQSSAGWWSVCLRRLCVNGRSSAVVPHLELFKLCSSQDCRAAWTTTRPARMTTMKPKTKADRCPRTQRARDLRRPPALNPPRWELTQNTAISWAQTPTYVKTIHSQIISYILQYMWVKCLSGVYPGEFSIGWGLLHRGG